MNVLDCTTAHFKGKPKPQARALRVRAVGSIDGWHFIVADTGGQIVVRHLGALPAYYAGLRCSQATATLYALAQAARWLQSHEPQSHVAMICTTPRADTGAKVRQ